MSFGKIDMPAERLEIGTQERIAYHGAPERLFAAALAAYDVGELTAFEPKTNGYEDYNVVLQTGSGPVFAKFFAAFRDAAECRRYTTMMSFLHNEAGVRCPPLIENRDSEVLAQLDIDSTRVNFCLMQYLDGGNIWESRRPLTPDEQDQVIEQAAAINRSEYRPDFIYDSWAITNLAEKYRQNVNKLLPQDRQMVGALLQQTAHAGLDFAQLPHCFVHGDIRETNVMRHSDGKVHVIDFSVANWYPRVVELAVLCADILFDPRTPESAVQRYEWGIARYQESGGQLTNQERALLPLCVRLAHAADLVGGSSADAANYISQAETDYWLAHGRLGLLHSPPEW